MGHVWKTLSALLLSAFLLLGQTAFAQTKFMKRPKAAKPECFCTDSAGDRKDLGDIICITIGSRSFMAKCVMAQNNPFWRDLGEGCLSSKLAPSALPVPPQTTVARLDHLLPKN